MGFLRGEGGGDFFLLTYLDFPKRVLDKIYFSEFGKQVRAQFISQNSYPVAGPDRPLGFQEVEASRVSRKSARVSGDSSGPKYRPPLPSENIPGAGFC
jgi:hypothetical protein